MIKLEMKRCFSGIYMLCILFAVAITIANLYEVAPYITHNLAYIREELDKGNLIYGQKNSVYVLWMATNISVMYTLFLRVMPLLIAIPYGGSFSIDNRGYKNHIMSRTTGTKYIVSKYITQFVGGGLMAIMPLIINLIMAACILPFNEPKSYTFYYALWEKDFCADLFYSDKHWLYLIIVLTINFVGYGLWGCLCFVTALWENNKYICIATPILCAYIVHSLGFIVPELSNCSIFVYPSLFNIDKRGIVYLVVFLIILALVIFLSLIMHIRKNR